MEYDYKLKSEKNSIVFNEDFSSLDDYVKMFDGLENVAYKNEKMAFSFRSLKKRVIDNQVTHEVIDSTSIINKKNNNNLNGASIKEFAKIYLEYAHSKFGEDIILDLCVCYYPMNESNKLENISTTDKFVTYVVTDPKTGTEKYIHV